MQSKKLGLLMLIALVTGNMIGSGVFLLPSNLAYIGSISLYSWVVTAVGAIILALMFARLSRQLPITGGPYAYTREGLGEFIGFQTAYCYWVTVWVGNAAIALAMVGYLRVFFPVLRDPDLTCYAAIAIVWVLTLFNMLSIRAVGWLSLITMVLKIIPLILVGTLGWFYINPEFYTQNFNITDPEVSNMSAIAIGAALTLWAFIGLESATMPAGSAENPKRNVPLATILGTLLAAAIYILSCAAIMGMIPAEMLQESTSPFADAAEIIFGPWGLWLIALGAIIATLGTLNGWILLQGQVAMAASDDNVFPRIFGKRNKRDLPVFGLFISSVLITVLLLLTRSPSLVQHFEIIILMAVFTALVPYFYTAIAEMVLLVRDQLFSFKVFIHFSIAVLAAVYIVWALWGSGNEIIYLGTFLLLSSVPVYAVFRRKPRVVKFD